MNKKLVILGAGESGTGSAILGKLRGWEVFVSDKGEIKEQYRQELDEAGIEWESGQHSEERILAADEVIKSPGIPDKAPLIQSLKKQGTPIISEIEFAARYTTAKLIGITGTNGKTTTTSLCYHIFQKAGLRVGLGGNIGKSFARQVALDDQDYYVLEISSFQLDDTYTTRFHAAALINITPDHLDRYNYELKNYIDSKFRITRSQTAEDLFVYCGDDPITMEHIADYTILAQRFPFTIDAEHSSPGAWVKDGELHIETKQTENNFTMAIQELSLRGKHNNYNSMAAAVIANAFNIRKEVIRESLSDFQNVEHRLESVGKVRGVEFINDSKATNVNSSWYALESMDRPVIWIAGGVDKGNDYNLLKQLVKDKVRIIVCLGLDNRKIHEAFSKDVDMILNTTSMQEAVKVAYHMADKEDAVLLSPACASFDLFENYEDRGRQFKKYVKNL
ncbi:MAG: UDP-N-acetylmuramoyl-L-alanine--D-glutamate ligase [Bacteroidetes bacterium]|nr:MAG: UDP-N-acetylmuramoyl-L-alanine--D-glutamate ligase [Bacteroidota bacterium]